MDDLTRFTGMDTNTTEGHVGLAEAARIVHLSPSTMRRLDRDGTLAATMRTPGGHRRYSVTALTQYVQSQRSKAS